MLTKLCNFIYNLYEELLKFKIYSKINSLNSQSNKNIVELLSEIYKSFTTKKKHLPTIEPWNIRIYEIENMRISISYVRRDCNI